MFIINKQHVHGMIKKFEFFKKRVTLHYLTFNFHINKYKQERKTNVLKNNKPLGKGCYYLRYFSLEVFSFVLFDLSRNITIKITRNKEYFKSKQKVFSVHII